MKTIFKISLLVIILKKLSCSCLYIDEQVMHIINYNKEIPSFTKEDLDKFGVRAHNNTIKSQEEGS